MRMRYLSWAAGIGMWLGVPALALAQAAPYKFNPETGLYEYTTVQSGEVSAEEAVEQAGDAEDEMPTQQVIQVDRSGKQVEDDAHRADYSPGASRDSVRSGDDGYRRAHTQWDGGLGRADDGYYDDGREYRRERAQRSRLERSGANREAYEAMMGSVTSGGLTNPHDDVEGKAARGELEYYSDGRNPSRRSQGYRDRNGYDEEYRDMERRDRNGILYSRPGGNRDAYNVQRYSRSAYRDGDDDDYGYGRDYYDRYVDGGYGGRRGRGSLLGEKGSNKDAYNEMMSQINGD